jgi:hypothetical protein
MVLLASSVPRRRDRQVPDGARHSSRTGSSFSCWMCRCATTETNGGWSSHSIRCSAWGLPMGSCPRSVWKEFVRGDRHDRSTVVLTALRTITALPLTFEPKHSVLDSDERAHVSTTCRDDAPSRDGWSCAPASDVLPVMCVPLLFLSGTPSRHIQCLESLPVVLTSCQDVVVFLLPFGDGSSRDDL